MRALKISERTWLNEHEKGPFLLSVFWVGVDGPDSTDGCPKKNNPAQIEQAVQLAHDALAYSPTVLFIIGLPGETSKSIKKIEAFVQNPCVGLYHLFPLADMDNSDLATTSEDFHFRRRDYLNWDHPSMSSREVPRLDGQNHNKHQSFKPNL